MEQLQTLLRQHIETSGYTIYSIAQKSGVNRTTLQKIISGQRRITPEVYTNLVPFFSISPAERAELDRAFLIEQIGRERYEIHMEIQRIFELPVSALSVSDSNLSAALITDIDKLEDYMFLDDAYQVANVFYSLLLQNIRKEMHPYLYTYTDMSSAFMSTLLKQILHPDFKNLQVTHLLEFYNCAQTGGHIDTVHNLRTLTNLLPFFATFTGEYSVQYTYTARDDFNRYASIFPYYCIMNSHVFLLSATYDSAFVIRSERLHSHYLDTWRHALSQAHTLTNGCGTAAELLDRLIRTGESKIYPICMNIQPTIEFFVTQEMADKYMKDTPYKELIRQKLFTRIGQLLPSGNTILFTQEGLHLLTEQGKNINFPDELAERFDIADRICILKQILACNSRSIDKANNFLMLNPKKFRTSLHLSFMIEPPSTLFLFMICADQRPLTIPLFEHNLCESIIDFIQTLPQYGYVLSLEETNQILEDEIRRLEQMNSGSTE